MLSVWFSFTWQDRVKCWDFHILMHQTKTCLIYNFFPSLYSHSRWIFCFSSSRVYLSYLSISVGRRCTHWYQQGVPIFFYFYTPKALFGHICSYSAAFENVSNVSPGGWMLEFPLAWCLIDAASLHVCDVFTDAVRYSCWSRSSEQLARVFHSQWLTSWFPAFFLLLIMSWGGCFFCGLALGK